MILKMAVSNCATAHRQPKKRRKLPALTAKTPLHIKMTFFKLANFQRRLANLKNLFFAFYTCFIPTYP